MFRKKTAPAEAPPAPLAPLPPLPTEDLSLTVPLEHGRFLKVGNAQNQGRRPYQEDSCGYSNLSDPALIAAKGVLAVLADGMGGLAHGKEVSTMAVAGMLEYFNAPGTPCENGEQLFAQAQALNGVICDRFCADGKINAGSTLVCALIRREALHWVCIGDSRLYLRRGGQLYQMNEDHDYLNRLLDDAVFDEEAVAAAFADPQKDVLVSCMGSRELVGDVSRHGFDLCPGDKLMLCSDGVYNALPQAELNRLLEAEPQTAAEQIEAAVLAQGFANQDNLTIITISYN